MGEHCVATGMGDGRTFVQGIIGVPGTKENQLPESQPMSLAGLTVRGKGTASRP